MAAHGTLPLLISFNARSHADSRHASIVVTVVVSACLSGLHVAVAQQRQMPPAWPYAQTQLPPGEIPPQALAPKTPVPNAAPVAARGETRNLAAPRCQLCFPPGFARTLTHDT
jgi:hypothetical protein